MEEEELETLAGLVVKFLVTYAPETCSRAVGNLPMIPGDCGEVFLDGRKIAELVSRSPIVNQPNRDSDG